MFSINLGYVSWTGRIVNAVGLIFVIFLLKTEICHFRKSDSTHTKRLVVLELIILISTVFITLQSITIFIPVVCEYTTNFHSTLISLQRLCLGSYQISRLQICFCSTQKQLANYGYHKYSYIVLYAIGVLVFGTNMIVSPLAFPIEPVQNYGCSYGAFRYRWSFIVLCMLAILYYLWDWTILAMYIYKMIQVKKHIKIQNDVVNHSPVDIGRTQITLKQVQKLQITLTKVTVLTVCYELSGLILVFPIIVLKLNFFTIPQIVLECIDGMFAAIIVFLMADHNTKHYLFISQLCCRSSSTNSDAVDSETAEKMSKKKNGDIDVVLPNQSKTTDNATQSDLSQASPLPHLILVQSVTKESHSVPRFCRSYLAKN